MEKSDEYYSYGGEEDYDHEKDQKVVHDDNWGSHGWAFSTKPFLDSDNPCMDNIYDTCTLIMIHYNIMMYHQKERCLAEPGWNKTELWKQQQPIYEALEEYWNNGMREYLSEKND